LAPISNGVPRELDNSNSNIWFEDYCGDPNEKDGIKKCTNTFLNTKDLTNAFNSTCSGKATCNFNPIKYLIPSKNKDENCLKDTAKVYM
jgi:hypothetical protein